MTKLLIDIFKLALSLFELSKTKSAHSGEILNYNCTISRAKFWKLPVK